MNKTTERALGLYRSEFEKGSCGIGFIAHLKGEKNHRLIVDGLQMLVNMQHRGGCGCDPDDGDGAGVLLRIDHDFFNQAIEPLGFSLPAMGNYGIGMLFLPEDLPSREMAKALILEAATPLNIDILGYRNVPVNKAALGQSANNAMPFIEQVFVSLKTPALDPMVFERKLYVFRKAIENRSHLVPALVGKDFFFSSLSSKTIVYKGLLTTGQVGHFFVDLEDPRLKSDLILVHSRFSTNTFPSWKLAQPFNYIAHNGEINTIKGNVNWMKSKETSLESALFSRRELETIVPICREEDSDSANLDHVVELLLLSGRSIPHAMMMVIPEAWQGDPTMEDPRRAFYEYHDCLMEPWDGPASICFTDGNMVGATMDRNGLRPGRYVITKDARVIMASEAGALHVAPENVLKKGRLKPGKMFIADLQKGRFLGDEEIKSEIFKEYPYREWLYKHKVSFADLASSDKTHHQLPAEKLMPLQQAFGFTTEELQDILLPMVIDGKEPVGSMGIDVPLAILSERPQNLASYFKQLFAQVTNPPIDPIREKLVTSSFSILGGYGGVLTATEDHCKQIHLKQPILTDDEIATLRFIRHPDFKICTIHTLFPANGHHGALERAVRRVCLEAQEACENGNNIIILSDKGVDKDHAPIPSLLITGAVHHHLIRKKIRINTSLVVESGDIREVHQFAVHIAYGASAIYPYLAFQSIYAINPKDVKMLEREAVDHYIKAISLGIIKVFSKMGISTFGSYHGAQPFEIVGLGDAVVATCFTGTVSRLGGLDFDDIAREALQKHAMGFPENGRPVEPLPTGGVYQWKWKGEAHTFNPESVHLLQFATATGDYSLFKKYSQKVDGATTPVTLRGLLDFSRVSSKTIPLDQVEPAREIVKRFASGAMSFGSISHEAHTTLAIAMNRLGGKSNSGEGGEDPARFTENKGDSNLNSAIKQIASGRFGVTSYYLSSAKELQIKMAQGAKPGEGGQLPGDKVDATIARVRHSTPGIGLISPPPHHDIYSIEDLAQLIFDLKNANPLARINVKLVAEAGVGTVAAGVVKAKADAIMISGHDGGTGASPVSSVMHAGLPWELGLAETQQTLVKNKLRNRVVLQADGQLRTGRDLAMAILLGAEEWGVATAALVSMGCIMMRKCHLNTCPVGIATQDETLRKTFKGSPEQVVNLFTFLAEELREIMAELGFKTVQQMVGQSQHLKVKPLADRHWKYHRLNLNPIVYKEPGAGPVSQTERQDHLLEDVLDQQAIRRCKASLEEKKHSTTAFTIRNTDRTVGAMLSYHISKRYQNTGLPDDTIVLKFIGSAGQSFGAFAARGLTLVLEGEANDYVGKGLSGGKMAIYPNAAATFDAIDNVIAGNVALFGATSGEAYLNGMAGERFAVRNSGASAVVEGLGDHGCEYMTGGTVVVLGTIGRNFAAGMSGGMAFLLDADRAIAKKINLDTVIIEPPNVLDLEKVFDLITKHQHYTVSKIASQLLRDWPSASKQFIKVLPKEYKQVLKLAEETLARNEK